MSRSYRAEFPDYPPETMPAIPPSWQDISWHNDTCPVFLATPSLGVWVDYADPALREFADVDRKRFAVVSMDDGQHMDRPALLETDDWAAVLHFVASMAR